MIKNMKNWLNESVEEGTKIIFKDLCKEYFDDNYGDMVNWLNQNATSQRVFFIYENGKIFYKNGNQPWENVNKYENFSGYVNVIFNNGEHGTATGLIFLEDLELPNQEVGRIRWYRKGKLEE